MPTLYLHINQINLTMKNFSLLFVFVVAMATAQAQITAPQPSPDAKVVQTVGLTEVMIEYSRPSMKGRDIFGGLVPYDKMWRTGANENTMVTFSDDVMIKGQELAQGTYALYTIPGKDSWEVIFYEDTSNWGLPRDFDESKVALRVNADAQKTGREVETFTIEISHLGMDNARLDLAWENTRVKLPFTVPAKEQTMASIEKTMSGPSAQDYYSAASFYFDAGSNMDKAHEYISKAVELRESAFWMWRKKAMIEAEMGKKKDAIASAKKSMELAQKAGNDDYVRMNKQSLKEWGAM